MKDQTNSQTAYLHNAHSTSTVVDTSDHGWTDAINRMVDQRYAFLAMQYKSSGYLFRGMSSGFFEALLEGEFWNYSGRECDDNFEQELDILLVTQDFSDAFTVSKLWESRLDACIIIFKSDVFNQALYDKKAAIMATAEPGVVFKYPFLTQPLSLNDIDYLIVSENLLAAIENKKTLSAFKELNDSKFTSLSSLLNNLHMSGKLIIPECTDDNCQRTSFEKLLQDHLLTREIDGAHAIYSDLKPIRTI